MKFKVGDRVHVWLDGIGIMYGTVTYIGYEEYRKGMNYDVLLDDDSHELPFSEDELSLFETPDEIFKDLLK